MSTSPTAAAAPLTSATATEAPTTTSAQTTPSETSTSSSSTSSSTSSTETTSTSSSETSASPTPTSTSATTTSSSTSSETTSTTSSSSSSSSSPTTEVSTSSGATTTLLITSTATGPSSTSSTDAANGASATDGSVANTTSNGGGGLSTGSTVAVAVVVPVVSVALIILAAIWFWRKRKSKKAAEEERRKEVEEYGFNPNNDPSLPPVGMGGTYEPKDDNVSGYRGWGTTSAGRKASTNLSSGVGMAMSDGSGGYHHAASPSEGTVQYSDGRPISGETEPVGVLGSAPAAAANRTTDIHRGPSNASSAYSAANRSEVSEESHMSAGHSPAGFYEDNPYYNDAQPQYQAYNPENPYGSTQPVIRDVQARRNTRIESPAVFPRQGNAGIAQNF